MRPRTALDSPAAIRRSAMDLLARREHSYSELLRKLRQRGAATDAAEIELDRLVEDGLLSDARFCEAYLYARSQRGYGGCEVRGGGRLREVGSAQGRLDARETVGDAPSPSLRYFRRLAQRGVGHGTRVSAPRRTPHREEHHVSVNLGMGLFEHAEALDHLRDGHDVVAVSREGVLAPVRGARVCHRGRRTRGLGDGPGGSARRP